MADSAHGTCRSYAGGCRCVRCRAANAAYTAIHRTRVGTVSAEAARAHLVQLGALGVGYRQAARLAGVSASVVSNVRSGRVLTVHPATSARLLGIVASVAPGVLVPATKTWRTLDSLRREGFTHRELAYRLGCQSQQLSLHPRRIRDASASKVAQLYARLTT